MLNYFDRLAAIPYLKGAFISYFLLGVTDTVHHLHAAMILGQGAAIHAAAIGMVLVPIAVAAAFLYALQGKKYQLWVFLGIAIIAIAVPGMYHGGWSHLVKVLAHLLPHGSGTELSILFPAQNYNLWFYEISGLFEFIIAIVCTHYVYMLMKIRATYG